MKKSIFAVLAVTAMGASHAQTADTSSVSLYGVIDEGYLSKQTNRDKLTLGTKKGIPEASTTSKSQTGFSSGNTSSSYIGIRTKENLGAGLDARATIEFGYNAHGETTIISPIRQAHVGLYSKDYGNLTIGRLHNKTYDFLASEGLGSGVLPGTILSNRVQGLDHIDGIRYSIGNEIITGYVSYGQNNSKTTETPYDLIKGEYKDTKTTNSNSYHQFELAVEGKYQGAFGKVAYIKGEGLKNNPENQTINSDVTVTIPGASNLSGQTLLANVGYDFGIIKPSYTFLQNKISGGYHNTKFVKQTFHQLGFTAPITGTINLFGSYYLKDADGVGSGDLGELSTKGGKGWQVGTTYHFSKRTNLYAAYGQESISFKYGNVPGVTGENDAKAYTIGLKHIF